MRKLRRKRWGITLAALAVVLIVPLSIRWYQARQVSKQLKQIELLDEPTTFVEILERYEKPSRDATSLWMEGFSLLNVIPEENQETLNRLPFVGFADEPRREAWKHVDLAAQYAQQREEASLRLHAAAEVGGKARFFVDADSGFAGFLHPNGLLDAHDLLRLETHLYGYRKDTARCAVAIRARLALARSLQNSPAFSSQTLNQAITAMALQDIIKFFDLRFSDEELAQFRSLTCDTHQPLGLTRAYLATRAEGITLFRDPSAAHAYFRGYNELLALPQVEVPKQILGLTTIPAHKRVLWSFLKPWDFHFFISTTEELIFASKCPWPEAIDRAAQTEDNLIQRQHSNPATHLLTGMLVKSPTAKFTGAAKHIAVGRVFDAAIAVELCRRRDGRTPGSLNELVPEFLHQIPVDPFSGEPLMYTMGDGAFTAYSIGPNRVDDGGDGSDPGNELDITCRISILPGASSQAIR